MLDVAVIVTEHCNKLNGDNDGDRHVGGRRSLHCPCTILTYCYAVSLDFLEGNVLLFLCKEN
jgi:hypothetical protein